MTTGVQLHLLKVGSCRHCERVTLQGGSLAATRFPALAALLIHPDAGPILFDTGYAAHFQQATEAFPERLFRWVTPVDLPPQQTLAQQLARFGLGPGDIRVCVISHFHADHIAGLFDLPNARFIAMQDDYAEIARRGRVGALLHGMLKSLLPPDFASRLRFADACPRVTPGAPWSGFGPGFDLLGDGSLLGMHLPGHSAGQLGLLLRDQDGREVFLCADACWSARAFRELRMPSLLARPLMHRWPAYRTSIEQLHRLNLQHAELVILPSHCDASLGAYQPAWRQQ